MAALKAWVGSAAHESLLRLIEAQAQVVADRLLTSAENSDFRRGQLTAYLDAYDLSERVIHTVEAFYERQRNIEQQHANRSDPGRHIGSPHFWK